MIQVSGDFTATATPADLMARQQQPARLADVATLNDVSLDDAGRIHALFTPRTPLGHIPLRTVITTDAAADGSATVTVHASRGPHTVDATLAITFDRRVDVTQVTWSGEVRLGGTAASVGQRVATDLVRSAIHETLYQLAHA
jgi:carbon monoxide dehydrogenase subunit G